MKKVRGYNIPGVNGEWRELPEEEKSEYLETMGLKESGLDRLINETYKLLNLITYYTAATDLQAWTIKKETHASTAAGKIHTDFERGFIRAEVYSSGDLIKLESENSVKEKGLITEEEFRNKKKDILNEL